MKKSTAFIQVACSNAMIKLKDWVLARTLVVLAALPNDCTLFLRLRHHCLKRTKLILQKLSSLSELLCAMKGVCRVMWAEDASLVDDLRLEVTLRMMKCPHFNAKMNALKEASMTAVVCRLLVLNC